jgi:small GTP-binding protein
MSYKIVTAGDSNAGKTSVVNRYVFKQFNENTTATVGAAFNMVIVNGVRMHIWDTAGNERYKSLTPMYIRNANMVFYCIDSSIEFDEPRHKNAIKDIESPIFIVATKSDIGESIAIKQFADLNKLPFFYVSAKTGENIDVLFDSAYKYLDKNSSSNSNIININPKSDSQCCF